MKSLAKRGNNHGQRVGDTQAKVLSENLKVHKIEAPYYEQLHHEIFNRIEQARLKRSLARHLEEPRGLRVLDYGCGTGNLTRALVHIGAIVTAADISPEMIALTQANLSKEIQAGLVQTLILGADHWLLASLIVLQCIPSFTIFMTPLGLSVISPLAFLPKGQF